jgi:hypothetical protein
MNESERDLLMPFLRKLVNSRTTPGDVAANNLIQKAVRNQPNAHYLLVQRALSLECELAAAQQRIRLLEGTTPAPTPGPQAADFLHPQAAQWGERIQGAADPTPSKLLFDLFIQQRSPQARDLESRVVGFVGRHAGRIWLVILAIAAVVVLVKEKLV